MLTARLLGENPSSILWKNSDQTVILIDIPHSIEEVQGDASGRHLLSSVPLSAPFPSQEPKSGKAKARLEQKSTDDDLHTTYRTLTEAALKDVQERYAGTWCLPRPFTDDSQPGQKRKLDEIPTDDLKNYPSISEHSEIVTNAGVHIHAIGDNLTLCNREIVSQIISLRPSNNHHQDRPPHQFRIPPQASFFLGNCTNAKAFRDTVRTSAKQTQTSPDFDFILLDPPWPNTSVKRTHKTPGQTYATFESMQDLHDMLLDTKVDFLMGETCTVGVWITNKPAARNVVLDGDRGLFACWDIELVEEWVWVKTTTTGEPVYPVDSLWRKPYEVLLIGRKRRKTEIVDGHDSPVAADVKRRVLVSVPDIHSRKPCLRRLLPLLLPDPLRQRTLEIFARHLVEGWWSWGNECIKFNWEGYWRDETE